MQSSLCPSRHFCPEGTSTPVPCPAGTVGRNEGLRRADQCQPCPMGSWCSAGREIACPEGTYNDKTGQDNQGACAMCPDNSVAPQNSASWGECQCKPGYFMNGTDVTLSTCKPCPLPGTTCDNIGTTLETIPLAHGYWRPHNASLDVRPCKDLSAGSESGCGGGIAPCNANRGLTGVYCQSCVDDGTYYEDSACRACGSLVEKWTASLIGVAVGLVALVLGACGLLRRHTLRSRLRRLQRRSVRGVSRAVHRFHLTSKLKNVYYDVNTKFL